MMNWRGFFFEPYDMDPTVTALEGENGAGKTTTMIAAHVALIPDKNLLHFQGDADGDGSKSDRGLYGRLGDKGPSYAILDFDIGGKRVLAGVQLKRGVKPDVNFERFIITDVPPDYPLQKLLLVQDQGDEEIPELLVLQEQVAFAGGQLRRFETMKEYGEQLFKLDIVPVPLDRSSERQKYHRMLKTSMEGGLSRDIQKSLRDYLLSEDEGLRSRLKQIRENLDQCRVTRKDIQKTLTKKETVEKILRAATGMFQAGFYATSLLAEELREDHLDARTAFQQAEKGLRDGEINVTDQERQHESIKEQLQRATEDCQGAKDLLDRRKTARSLKREIDVIEPEHKAALTSLQDATARHEEADRDHREAVEKRDALSADYASINERLGDMQKAWESVAKQAGLYNDAVRKIQDAQGALPDREVTASTIPTLVDVCDKEWKDANSRKAEVSAILEQAEQHRNRFDEVLAALSRLAGTKVQPTEALDIAQQVDEDLRDKKRAVDEAKNLPAEIEDADGRGRRQGTVRRDVAQLSTRGLALQTANEVRQAYEEHRRNLQVAREDEASLREELDERKSQREEAEREVTDLEARRAGWTSMRRLVSQLEESFGREIPSQEAVTALSAQLLSEESTLTEARREHLDARRENSEGILELQSRGGIDETVLELSQRLGCPLVAERFDDTPEEDAAEVEARLGPLHAALLVDDVDHVAAALARIDTRPDTVWMVDTSLLQATPDGTELRDSFLIPAGDAWRLTRKPAHPIVGQAAREKKIRRLKEEEARLEAELESIEQQLATVRAGKECIEKLYREAWAFVGQEDPSPQLEEAARRARVLRSQQEETTRLLAGKRTWITSLDTTIQALTPILPHADLLDERDWALHASRLRDDLAKAKEYQKHLTANESDWATLRNGILHLQRVPPSDGELFELREECARCSGILNGWKNARHALHAAHEVLPNLAYADQVRVLAEKTSIRDELRDEARRIAESLDGTRTLVTVRSTALDERQKARESARDAFSDIDARLTDRQKRFQATGEDGSEEGVSAASNLLSSTQAQREKLDHEERGLEGDLRVSRDRVKTLGAKVTEARGVFHAATERLIPVWKDWSRLRRATKRSGFLDRLKDPSVRQQYCSMGRIGAGGNANERLGELRFALRETNDTEEVVERLGGLFQEDGSRRPGMAYLEAWLAVRSYLARSIPRDIVETDNPERALEVMAAKLTALQEKLRRQEEDFVTRSDDVAKHILIQINRERTRILRLNGRLKDVSFGSIRGVNIEFEQIDSMTRLLESLRSQPGFFAQLTDTMSLEEALAEVYKQVTGGEVKGHDLLDYRRYVKLSITVRRLNRDDWEVAGSGLSNGESIGVGAAILMVIQESWEHQAAMLYGRSRNHRSLRFLFLDEAARLSPKSLMTLAEFCNLMDMQLLVAAPAADQAECGRIFTLVRDVKEGREEVFVSGRMITKEVTSDASVH